MCNPACIRFGLEQLSAAEIAGQRILEVGARNVNGSLRQGLEALGPREYIGLDLVKGPGVDVIGNARDLVLLFRRASFDVVITTEMLEHVQDWRGVVTSLKQVLRPGGILLITTRSPGCPRHNYPVDYWRYSLEDMRAIFADLQIVALEPDPNGRGVFMKARKPEAYVELDLAGLEVHTVDGKPAHA